MQYYNKLYLQKASTHKQNCPHTCIMQCNACRGSSGFIVATCLKSYFSASFSSAAGYLFGYTFGLYSIHAM